MAEKQEEKGEKQIAEKKTAASAAEVTTVKQSPPWALITIGIVSTVIVFVLLLTGWWFIVAHKERIGGSEGDPLSRHFGNNNRMFSRGGGDFGGRREFMNGAASGVITSVDGDTLKVAGNGKEVIVKKTSNTTISGSKTDLAVNDSVTVIGSTDSDGVVTATRILIRNIDSSDTSAVPGV